MTDNFLKGSWVALITPFKDGKIDYPAVEKLLDMHLKAKTDGILVCGTTGEAVTMSFEEKKELMAYVKKHLAGRTPIMFGSGSNCTKQACELTSKAKELGADAALVVVPFYNKPTQSGLKLHYKEVAASTDLPVVLYNVPGRTGCNMTAETTLELAQIENVKAIKEASGNLDQIQEIIRKSPEGFNLLSGDDGLNFQIMASGGKGTISVTANIAPAMMKKFNDACLNGDYKTALDIHYKLLDAHRGLFVEANPIPTKAALKEMGIICDEVRLPLSLPSALTQSLVKNLITDLE